MSDEVQWFQSERFVSVSVLRKTLSATSVDDADITSELTECSCSILVRGTTAWECNLAGFILPKHSRMFVRRARVELKLLKETFEMWPEFEFVKPVPMSPVSAESDTETDLDAVAMEMETIQAIPDPALTSGPRPPREGPSAGPRPPQESPSAGPRPPRESPSAGPRPPRESPSVCDVVECLSFLPHDVRDMGGSDVQVIVNVSDMKANTLAVFFREQNFDIIFQKTNHSATERFKWSVNLFDEIVPGECSYSVKNNTVTLSLRKASHRRWKALEAPRLSTSSTDEQQDRFREQRDGSGERRDGSGEQRDGSGEHKTGTELSQEIDDNLKGSALECSEDVEMEPPSQVKQEAHLEVLSSEPSASGEVSSDDNKEPRLKTTPVDPPDSHSRLQYLPSGGLRSGVGGMRVSDLLALQGEGIGVEEGKRQGEEEEEEEEEGAVGNTWERDREGSREWRQQAATAHEDSKPSEGGAGNAKKGKKRAIEEEESSTPPFSTPPSSPPPLPPNDGVPAPSSTSKTSQHPNGNLMSARGQRSPDVVSSSSGEVQMYTNPAYQKPGSTNGASKKRSASHRIAPSEIESSNPSYKYRQLRRPCLTGLLNTGNTCFMNSTMQCLSNTQEVRDYFIDGHFLADINRDNPLGFKGDLAKCFSQIIRKLWSGEHTYFSPKRLKTLISSRSGHFSGYQPHDSHEFMSYLLDGLHEDLNRVRHKPTTTCVESDERPDAEVAEEAWHMHKLRNNSFFVDLFQGQFKSTLVCPVCSKVSVTFDPFMSMSVPIPQNLRHLPVIFVPHNLDAMPREYILKLPPDASLELLKASVARKTGLPMPDLRVFEAFSGKFQTMLSNNQESVRSIGENDIIIVCEVLSSRAARGRVVEVNIIQRLRIPDFPTKCESCGKKVSTDGRKLQRCGNCKAVGYCNRDCQTTDWSFHKMRCHEGRPSPVGLPFVVSLPVNEVTYSRLASTAEKLARRSVDFHWRNPSPLLSSQVHAGGGGSASNLPGLRGKEPQDNREASAGSESSDGGESATGGNSTSAEATVAGQRERAMYSFTSVDKYGDTIDGATPLEDKGSKLLRLSSGFLAMDWKNDPSEEDYVVVTPKVNGMEYERDSTVPRSSSSYTDISLEQCLELFTEPESLGKEEAWYCSKCKDHREATKQMSVWKLPKFLIIHLKRFSFGAVFQFRTKINKLITYPVRNLDMSPYMLDEASKHLLSDCPPIYDLYGIVYHFGNSYVGHYTAAARPPSDKERQQAAEWILYDDDQVFTLSEDKVQTKCAYILFYHRREPSVVSPETSPSSPSCSSPLVTSV